jgi:hypothetical protein
VEVVAVMVYAPGWIPACPLHACVGTVNWVFSKNVDPVLATVYPASVVLVGVTGAAAIAVAPETTSAAHAQPSAVSDRRLTAFNPIPP